MDGLIYVALGLAALSAGMAFWALRKSRRAMQNLLLAISAIGGPDGGWDGIA